jgi:hypothetical protein
MTVFYKIPGRILKKTVITLQALRGEKKLKHVLLVKLTHLTRAGPPEGQQWAQVLTGPRGSGILLQLAAQSDGAGGVLYAERWAWVLRGSTPAGLGVGKVSSQLGGSSVWPQYPIVAAHATEPRMSRSQIRCQQLYNIWRGCLLVAFLSLSALLCLCAGSGDGGPSSPPRCRLGAT